MCVNPTRIFGKDYLKALVYKHESSFPKKYKYRYQMYGERGGGCLLFSVFVNWNAS